jgi:fluoroquinolone transport system permease protein
MQLRYGFLAAGVVVTLVWAALLWPLSRDLVDLWLPVVLYNDVLTIGLLFISGVVFFDRRQGMIDALAVSPMSTRAWLLSKVVSLTLLVTAVASGLVVLLCGWRLAWGRLLPALVLSSALFVLIGFLGAARLKTISGFLTFFILVSLPSSLPPLAYFDVWNHPVIWLLPFQPALVAIRHGFRPGDPAELAGALAALVVWISVFYRFAIATFHRHLASRPGVA